MATGRKTKKANKLQAVFNKQEEHIGFKKENRRSEIIEETHYVVKMYVGNELAEERPVYGKSRRYAEDCAENWDNGII
tara:strand:- start:2380 stop:2613 length:234 start_codon:yes stop_codon:yes gene_type:complete